MSENGDPQATPTAPATYNTVNPFIITADAGGMIDFLEKVFGAREVAEAHTLDTDGLILHSELKIGHSVVMVADRKPDWPFTPSLLQVYVDDLPANLERAKGLGGSVVTDPTDLYGTTFARVLDPWRNLWWIWHHREAPHGSQKEQRPAWPRTRILKRGGARTRPSSPTFTTRCSKPCVNSDADEAAATAPDVGWRDVQGSGLRRCSWQPTA